MGSQKKKKKANPKENGKEKSSHKHGIPTPRASLEVDVSAAGAEALEDIGSNS